MLSPFLSWSNCTIQDIYLNTKKSRVRNYYPMDSNSLVKSIDMPAVGALYPRSYAKRGYWWWKSQEINYALRPKSETFEILKKKLKENAPGSLAVFQVRRTDKTQGCAKIYGTFQLKLFQNFFRNVSFSF